MSLRTRLFLFFTLALLAAVGFVAAGVTTMTRRAFEQQDARHSEAIVAQFQQEFQSRGEEVFQKVQGIAESEATVRMAIDLGRPSADASLYVNDAKGLASSHQLDFLDLYMTDGTIISSAEWPARFGYKEDWIKDAGNWSARGAFLQRVELQDGPALGLIAVVPVRVGDQPIYVVGGTRLGSDFLASLSLPEGTRALLYQNLGDAFSPATLTDVSGAVPRTDQLAPLIEKVRGTAREITQRVNWSADSADAETFYALPLLGRQRQLLGVLLVGNSRRNIIVLERRIRALAMEAGLAALLLGLLLSAWASVRVTRPVARLAAGAREVAAGNWNVKVEAKSRDEIGQLAGAFNHMTGQLADQQERLLQAERVAAWRELARRLAHELKNPLFPLQITIENLRRAREQSPEQFDEVFRESTATLLAELENLKVIVARFSDFAKMPTPELRPMQLNDVVRGAEKVFEAHFSAIGRPSIVPELYLAENLPLIEADEPLLRRAIENLILNAMDAMPGGGTLVLRTAVRNGNAVLTVTDSGVGLTPRRATPPFHSVLHFQTARHRAGSGHRSIRGQRSWRRHHRGKRARARHHVSD